MFFLRKVAAGVMVVAISSAIFFLMVSDKTTKKNVLRPTLESLGEKLFAAVRADSSKENLQKNYLDFVNRAEAKEIKPEEIEKIAADILNLSGRDSLISSKEAMKILALKPEREVFLPENEITSPVSAAPPVIVRREKRPSVPEYEMSEEKLAERLQKMAEVQRKLQKISIEIKKDRDIPADYLTFRADSGLVVEINLKLKKLLEDQDRLLAKQFSDLEKKKWLQWQEAIKDKNDIKVLMKDSLFSEKLKMQKLFEQESKAHQESHPSASREEPDPDR